MEEALRIALIGLVGIFIGVGVIILAVQGLKALFPAEKPQKKDDGSN